MDIQHTPDAYQVHKLSVGERRHGFVVDNVEHVTHSQDTSAWRTLFHAGDHVMCSPSCNEKGDEMQIVQQRNRHKTQRINEESYSTIKSMQREVYTPVVPSPMP